MRPPGWHHSAATIKKLRQSHIGRKLTDEHKAAISAAVRGRKMTDLQRLALIGRKVSVETRNKIRLARLGKKRAKLSDEAKDNIRKGMSRSFCRLIGIEEETLWVYRLARRKCFDKEAAVCMARQSLLPKEKLKQVPMEILAGDGDEFILAGHSFKTMQGAAYAIMRWLQHPQPRSLANDDRAAPTAPTAFRLPKGAP
jgi:hypothetical protein